MLKIWSEFTSEIVDIRSTLKKISVPCALLVGSGVTLQMLQISKGLSKEEILGNLTNWKDQVIAQKSSDCEYSKCRLF